ncbi:MAG TPA: GNAT family N-acetyltransferase [Streptosporangiaceae bacterium]
MADSPTNLRLETLTENEWSRLRDVRLSALRDHPSAFLASHEREAAYDEQRWRQEFSRGEWNILQADDKQIGLLGVTREWTMPLQECYLEFLWVAPDFRRSGVGSKLLRTVLDRLRDSGVHTVWLYILNGNQDAMRFYQRFGFQSTNERHLLPGHPAGSEERMKLRLD